MAEHRRPDTIPGYTHPTELKYSRNSMYKTFTEGKKAKKKEKFGKTVAGKQYATYGEIDSETCPECNTPSVATCHCAYSDKKCSNGHIWYINRDGKIKSGNPH